MDVLVVDKAGGPLLRTLLVEAAHSLARWEADPSDSSTLARRARSGPAKR